MGWSPQDDLVKTFFVLKFASRDILGYFFWFQCSFCRNNLFLGVEIRGMISLKFFLLNKISI